MIYNNLPFTLAWDSQRGEWPCSDLCGGRCSLNLCFTFAGQVFIILNLYYYNPKRPQLQMLGRFQIQVENTIFKSCHDTVIHFMCSLVKRGINFRRTPSFFEIFMYLLWKFGFYTKFKSKIVPKHMYVIVQLIRFLLQTTQILRINRKSRNIGCRNIGFFKVGSYGLNLDNMFLIQNKCLSLNSWHSFHALQLQILPLTLIAPVGGGGGFHHAVNFLLMSPKTFLIMLTVLRGDRPFRQNSLQKNTT